MLKREHQLKQVNQHLSMIDKETLEKTACDLSPRKQAYIKQQCLIKEVK